MTICEARFNYSLHFPPIPRALQELERLSQELASERDLHQEARKPQEASGSLRKTQEDSGRLRKTQGRLSKTQEDSVVRPRILRSAVDVLCQASRLLQGQREQRDAKAGHDTGGSGMESRRN